MFALMIATDQEPLPLSMSAVTATSSAAAEPGTTPSASTSASPLSLSTTAPLPSPPASSPLAVSLNSSIEMPLRRSGPAPSSASELAHSTETLSFQAGNPDVETVTGIIHLYREPMSQCAPDQPGSPVPPVLPAQRGVLLCALAVPAHIAVTDFVNFTAPYASRITHLRILRDSLPARYMVVMCFCDVKSADAFYSDYHGRVYTTLESDVCSLVWVRSVEFTTKSVSAAKDSLARTLFPKAPSGLVEIPSCPVCLERLDSAVSGIITILCNHSFHCGCLVRWEGASTCAICRFPQQPQESVTCSECTSTSSLWICLICGHLGCGRYSDGRHAYKHFQDTHHTYALELHTQRVWDYVGDGYVHRLLQAEHGKLVEGKSSEFSGAIGGGGLVPEGKVEAVWLECDYLLRSQLETQRHHYEMQLAAVERERVTLRDSYDASVADATHLRQQVARLERDARTAEKNITRLRAQVAKFEEDAKFLREVNGSLTTNQRDWQQRLVEVEARSRAREEASAAKVAELEEQIRDLMFFLDAQRRIESEGGADAREGTVTGVGPSPEASPTGKAGARRGRGGRR